MSVLSELLPSGGGAGGSLEAVASGSLSNGDTVVVNSDGTVSVIEETIITQSVGSPTVYGGSSSESPAIGFYSVSDKVIVAWSDDGPGKARVGTVSGTSISFGSAVTFQGSAEGFAIASDTTNEKVVVCYRNNNNQAYPTAVVGTVSGTSISFGSPVAISTATNGDAFNAFFDPNNNQIIVVWGDGNVSFGIVSGSSIAFGSRFIYDSNAREPRADFHPETGALIIVYKSNATDDQKIVVGQVSDGSISFGSIGVLSSSLRDVYSVAFNSSGDKAVFAYRDYLNSDYGTVKVASVTGTSVSLGSPVVFQSSSTNNISMTFDANAEKFVIGYENDSESGRGQFIVGTISGLSMSFGTAVIFETGEVGPTGGGGIRTTFDSVSNKVVASYLDFSNSERGTAVVFRNASNETNLTAENYIGISDSDYADGATATIQSLGSVNESQSGLTAGQAYYVQTDGTLSTTPDDPEVFAGTAVSATKLIVKG